MSANLKAYLAEKYMSGPKADAILSKVATKNKKKKRKGAVSATTSGCAMIVDEDSGWADQPPDDAEDLEEAVIEKDRGFKKRRLDQQVDGESGGWAVLQEGTPEQEQEQEDEKPLIVETEESKAFIGGLVQAKDLKKVLNREPHDKTKGTQEGMTEDEIAQMQETVYRDASGRKIDTKAERAEAARKKREREEKEAKKMEWGKGLVQREDEEKRKQELEKQKTTTFARYADDKELNEQLKAKDRWNDPAAAFLTVGNSVNAVRADRKSVV